MRTLKDLMPQRQSTPIGTVARLLLDLHAAIPSFNPLMTYISPEDLKSEKYIIGIYNQDGPEELMVLASPHQVQFDSIEEDENQGLLRWTSPDGCSDFDCSNWQLAFLAVNGNIITINEDMVYPDSATSHTYITKQ